MYAICMIRDCIACTAVRLESHRVHRQCGRSEPTIWNIEAIDVDEGFTLVREEFCDRVRRRHSVM